MTAFLISGLPGKALRTLVESRGLPNDSTCVLEAEPGQLDIARHEPGIPSCFSLHACDYGVIIDFRVDSTSLTTSLKSATS